MCFVTILYGEEFKIQGVSELLWQKPRGDSAGKIKQEVQENMCPQVLCLIQGVQI